MSAPLTTAAQNGNMYCCDISKKRAKLLHFFGIRKSFSKNYSSMLCLSEIF